MATFRSLASRLAALFHRREWDDRVDEELEFHIRMQTEENIRFERRSARGGGESPGNSSRRAWRCP